MKSAVYLFILLSSILPSCNSIENNDSNSGSVVANKEGSNISSSKADSLKLKSVEQSEKFSFPEYPRIGKGYKFLGFKDSIHYVLIVERTNDSTIIFQTDSDIKGVELHHGTATLNRNSGTITEESVITGNKYKSFEFVQDIDSINYQIRIGIDSVGTGDRLLVRMIKKEADIITTDLNMAN